MSTTTAAKTAVDLIVYALPASQFVFKVLAALDGYKVPHYVHFVSGIAKERQEFMKSGGSAVPVLKVVSSGQIVAGSESILEWLNDKNNNIESISGKLYPTATVSEVSKRASDGVLAGMVWYYNWVNDPTYEATTRQFVAQFFPVPPQLIPGFALNWFLKDDRATKKKQVLDVLIASNSNEWKDNIVLEAEAFLEDESKMRAKLLQELEYFQSLLTTKEDQTYLIPETSEPTAADFSVYAQVERLVGGKLPNSEDQTTTTTSSDYPFPTALPDLLQEASLTKLWNWYNHMKNNYPVKFKGKRPPKELIAKL